MAQPVSEFHDIQRVLLFGFKNLEEASFLLLRITDVAKAKDWLAAITGGPGEDTLPYWVNHAGHGDQHDEKVMQIAFTAQGLLTLGVPKDLFPDDLFLNAAEDRTQTFSREFYLGLAGEEAEREGRSRRLGDIGRNAPSYWDWGAPEQLPDILVMLYAKRGALAAFQQMIVEDVASGFEVFRVLGTAPPPDSNEPRREPFGFVDGISQPDVDWEARREPGTRSDLEYGNLISAGEFLLGYKNEYGLYTHRPLLAPERDPENILPPAEDNPDLKDLGRNGTYLVFRHLDQDLSGFRTFVAANSPKDRGVSLAEAMVGRKLSTGDPLVPASKAKIRGVGPKAQDIRQNGFTFDTDPDGLACPFGAHIRRANPRNGDMPGGRQGFLSWLLRMLGLKRGGPRDDLISSSRFHRIIRRGRPYGTVIDWKRASQDENRGLTSGLYFIALNANISRQFEFIQNAWIVNAKFDGLDGESDPLLGNRIKSPLDRPTDGFSLPQPSGPNRRITGLPQFVTVRGSAYFFLPGLQALRFIARQSVNS